MTVTVSAFNHTLQYIAAVGTDNITPKLQLLSSDAAFDATNTALTDVNNAGAYIVGGNGWDSVAEALTLTTSTVTTNDVSIDAADLSVTASGGAIGPASAAVIYDDGDADDAVLFFVTFGEAKQADDTTDFKVTFASDGLMKISVA